MQEAGISIPWSDVIRFHMDIVGRGEESFFSFFPDDEASQCTLTDLLPALYRGRRWAVIGDSDQLPAFATVRATEEQALSQKYGLEPFLDRVGHSDLFTLCAVYSEPDQRGADTRAPRPVCGG